MKVHHVTKKLSNLQNSNINVFEKTHKHTFEPPFSTQSTTTLYRDVVSRKV